MIQLNNLKIAYGTHEILDETTLTIHDQSMTLFRGPSGCGKSSILYRIGLISEYDDFEYVYNGEIIRDTETRNRLRQNEISFVFQDNSLFEQYDVLGNMKLYSKLSSKNYSEKDYKDILKIVNLDIPFHQTIQTLSGGQRQRLAIACALCKDTNVIILDEPTSNLDSHNEKLIFNVLSNLVKVHHKTIIISSHSESANEYADYVYTIKNGQLTEEKKPRFLDLNAYHQDKKDINELSFSFYVSYMQYFLKKYKIYEMGMVLIMTFSLVMINFLIINTNRQAKSSIESFQKLSENQMFITQNSENTTLDSYLKDFEFIEKVDAKIYPYIRTNAFVGEHVYEVVPLFKENDLSDQMLSKYTNDKIYLSYYGYRDLANESINPENQTVKFMVEDQMIDDEYSLGGILKKNNQCHYFQGEKRYLYCDYDVLKQIYDSHIEKNRTQYQGYTLFANTYDDYVELSGSFDNCGVNLFFDHFDEMENLEKVSKMTSIMIIACGFVLTSALFVIIEYYSLKRRNKELLMLKLNGVDNQKIVAMILMETIIKMSVAFTINLVIIYAFVSRSLDAVYISGINMAGYIFIDYINQSVCIKKLSLERVLRNYN